MFDRRRPRRKWLSLPMRRSAVHRIRLQRPRSPAVWSWALRSVETRRTWRGYEYPEALGAEEFQEYLPKEASEVPCAKVRNAAAYVKKPEALESEAGGGSPEGSVCCWEPARRRRLRDGTEALEGAP
jgi:hypothetical protein